MLMCLLVLVLLVQEEKRRQEQLQKEEEERAAKEFRKGIKFQVRASGCAKAWDAPSSHAAWQRTKTNPDHNWWLLFLQARPMPKFDQPFFAMPSEKPLTQAKTPNFASKRLKRTKS
jgi:hypothetical protein